MELTQREKEILKGILNTELSEEEAVIASNDDPKDVAELNEFYANVRSIMEKIQ